MVVPHAAVRRVAAGIALGLVPWVASPPPASFAMSQETADSLDLNGEWRFDTEEIVRVRHDGTTVRAEFVEGAECFDGRVRPYFLDGVLSGSSLTGNMMVCSRNPRLVEECGISSMYETTFEATVEPGRIAGTRIAQGLATEESGDRYTSCVPDSRYDGTYSFEGHSCSDAERELAELNAQLEAMVSEVNAIGDQLSAMPPVGNWLEEGYSGPNADLAARYRENQEEMAQVIEQLNATQDAGEAATLRARLDTLDAEANSLGDVLSFMNATDWTRDDYIGPNAELASRWRELNVEVVAYLPRLAEVMARVAECGGEECPSPAEEEELLARLEGMVAEQNAIRDQLSAMPQTPNWFEEGYAGANAEMAARWRAIYEEMPQLIAQSYATEDPDEKATIEARLDALGQEIGPLQDALTAMNTTDWTQDDYVGPNADLAARWRELDTESNEVFHQFLEAEQRRRECEEAVG